MSNPFRMIFDTHFTILFSEAGIRNMTASVHRYTREGLKLYLQQQKLDDRLDTIYRFSNGISNSNIVQFVVDNIVQRIEAKPLLAKSSLMFDFSGGHERTSAFVSKDDLNQIASLPKRVRKLLLHKGTEDVSVDDLHIGINISRVSFNSKLTEILPFQKLGNLTSLIAQKTNFCDTNMQCTYLFQLFP